ncbi:MAG: copper chaperone PCu(A)C [Alphaproteobacteria bacterium]|nr:copper chaperone PCu(A)C [Alphaproteobacteria bacterium]
MAIVRGLAALVIAAGVLGGAVPAQAHDHVQGSLTIVHPWSRATAPSQKAGGVFLVIQNAGDRPDRLIGIESDMADIASLHASIRDGDVVKMRPVKGGIEVPAKGEVALAPGGKHVMLIGLREQLIKESTFPLTLIFERAGPIEVVAVVESAGARRPAAGDPEHDHDAATARSGK